jgi:hypothetical protein
MSCVPVSKLSSGMAVVGVPDAKAARVARRFRIRPSDGHVFDVGSLRAHPLMSVLFWLALGGGGGGRA